MKKSITGVKAVLLATLIGILTVGQTAEVQELKLGVVGEHNEAWESVAERLKALGIKLTLVKFADYTLPNRALNDGEIDLNAFQHKAYLHEDIREHGYQLEEIANTVISPLGLYSQKLKALDELKEGDTIAIPNDPTNGGRALKLLQKGGLIELDGSKGYVPTVRDITKNPLKLKIYEVDAGNTASLLPDVAAAVINSNYAVDNNLDPIHDPIFSDGVGTSIDPDNPYINVLVAKRGQKGNQLYQKLIEVYQTKETAEIILRVYKGGEVPVFKY